MLKTGVNNATLGQLKLMLTSMKTKTVKKYQVLKNITWEDLSQYNDVFNIIM